MENKRTGIERVGCSSKDEYLPVEIDVVVISDPDIITESISGGEDWDD